MTRDDIIRLALMGERSMKQRIQWAVDMEREECAKAIAAEINDEIEDEAYCILVALLARIRARGQQ